MITDPQVFDDAFTPRRLLHRGAERDHLAHNLEPAAGGGGAEDVLIHGPPGVGKTTLSKHVLRRLEAETAAVDTVHVHCLGLDAADILRQIAADVDVGVREEWTVGDLRARLQDSITQPTIVVLDEADAVPETGVIDNLAGVPRLSVVAIAHSADEWVSRLGAAHRHRFEGDGQLALGRYGTAELADILQRRARRGLARDAWDWTLLKQIADDVAGVARDGIQTLGAAAEVATERGHDGIRGVDVDAGRERARSRIRKANLHSLPFHHHVLYALISEAGEIGAGELHDRYEARADAIYRNKSLGPVGERSRRDKLTKLRGYDLIEAVGKNKHRRYRVQDETIAPAADVLD